MWCKCRFTSIKRRMASFVCSGLFRPIQVVSCLDELSECVFQFIYVHLLQPPPWSREEENMQLCGSKYAVQKKKSMMWWHSLQIISLFCCFVCYSSWLTKHSRARYWGRSAPLQTWESSIQWFNDPKWSTTCKAQGKWLFPKGAKSKSKGVFPWG